MPLPISTSITTRKRTRSNNINENGVDHQQATPTVVGTQLSRTTATSANILSRTTNPNPISGLPKRQRNNPPTSTAMPPPIPPRSIYSLRNRSLTSGTRQPLVGRFPSLTANTTRSATRNRYNLRPRQTSSQVTLPDIAVSSSNPTAAPRRIRRPITSSVNTTPLSSTTPLLTGIQTTPTNIPPSAPPPEPPPPISTTSSLSMTRASIPLSAAPAIPPRQYRLVYLSDDDDELPSNRPTATTAFLNRTINLVTDDEDEEYIRPPISRRGASRSISGAGLQTRFRSTNQNPASAISTSSSSSASSFNSSGSLATINTQDFINGVAHVRLNRAIEIVIDSIQSLEGAVNNFDQLVLGLIYGPMTARTELESLEGMIRLSRILNLNIPARLTQEEIDSLPKIRFDTKINGSSSILLAEKCPICLTEFDDQETINKLHCTHLFHLQCISTWLGENDSCPTCRRKVIIDALVDE